MKAVLCSSVVAAWFFGFLPNARSAPGDSLPVAEGTPVDVAPWGERTSWEEGKDVGVYWEDPRDIVRVSVTFAGAAPPTGSARLQWWQSRWPDQRIPRDHVSGAGESGWLNVGDWYQGRWRDGDCDLEVKANVWTFTFRPVNEKEFPRLKGFAAAYRTTYKVRLLFASEAPKIAAFQTFSDSQWKSAELDFHWGGTARGPQVWDGRLEVFNGYLQALAPLGTDTGVTLRDDGSWASRVDKAGGGVQARIWYTASPNVNSFDRTIATVRARQASFSVDVAEAAGGAEIFSPYYGVIVTRADRATTYAEAEARWKKAPEKPLYERVFDEPEQTLAHARSEMPPKRRIYFPLGCEGGRQRFGVEPDGSVFCVNDRIDHPHGRDTDRRVWGGNRLRYRFGVPKGDPEKRWIEDHTLPIIHTQWERAGVRYTESAFATRFERGGLGWPDMQADDTTVLMLRVAVENTTYRTSSANMEFSVEADGRPLTLTASNGFVYAELPAGRVLRGAVEMPDGGTWSKDGARLVHQSSLQAGERRQFDFKIPFITLDQPGELADLKALDYEEQFQRVKDFWSQREEDATRIHTPVEALNDFYKADLSHLLINCGREVGSDRLMARVGSFSYGVYGNESCMMITDLDRRGLHREAARCLETFLRYQGTLPLPGDYDSSEGVFNGAGGWESGGYNQHHGWILWAMAEHFWSSGDAAWLEKNADKLILACRWIIRERARTKSFPAESLRGIERGLLPPGSLEDIQDWRCWLSNNIFSWWGMDAVARALEAVHHPQAADLIEQAEAYRADLLAAFREAMIRSPMVRLRDGSYIPQIPSEVHRRGRSFGWITTTLEGPIYLIRTGAIAPNDPLAKAIMEDYEDNLYLSEQFGYPPSHLAHWFSQGGFSMQPNLLCSPHPYLLRDEIKHFLRAYFNAFAVAYYDDTQMLTEHPLPEMGDWRGDHYKSSDESNSTFWLRLMFIEERGDDLLLGMAVPRAWLADGESPSIEKAATAFGPMNLKFESQAGAGVIRATVDLPTRRVPAKTWLRIRHPEEKRMKRVSVNGRSWEKFDAEREWIELPKGQGRLRVEAFY